jgi:hypothetical protein
VKLNRLTNMAPGLSLRQTGARARATCWRLQHGVADHATCQLSFDGRCWDLRLEVNDTLQWSARFRDQRRLLEAALSWKQAFSDRGWL